MAAIGYEKNLVYLICNLTPLHAGSGSKKEGFVDLPIQRDTFDFPCIYSSSLKGALRGNYHARASQDDKKIEGIIFGPEKPTEEGEFMSSVALTDAKLLFITVRSLYGDFALASTHFLLRRANQYFKLGGAVNLDNLLNQIDQDKDEVIVSKNSKIIDGKKRAYIQEIQIDNIKDNLDLVPIFNKIFPPNLVLNKEELVNHVIILNDKFSNILKRATLLATRIAVNYETKTVKPGALWTEEYVPELSIFYCNMLISKPRKQVGNVDSADSVLNKLHEVLAGSKESDEFVMLLGGHETLGRGIVKFYRIAQK
jgi:CRISPR-associated protein Cmr4